MHGVDACAVEDPEHGIEIEEWVAVCAITTATASGIRIRGG